MFLSFVLFCLCFLILLLGFRLFGRRGTRMHQCEFKEVYIDAEHRYNAFEIYIDDIPG